MKTPKSPSAFVFLVLAIVLAMPIAFSLPDGLGVSIENVVSSVNAGETASYNVVLINSGSIPLQVALSVSGPKADSWIQPYDYSVTVEPGAIRKVPVRIRPLSDAPSGNFAYSVSVQVKNEETGAWESLESAPSILMSVTQPETSFSDLAKIYLSLFDEKPEYSPSDNVQVQVQIYSLKEIFPELNLEIKVLDSRDRQVYSFTTPITSQKEPIKPIFHSVPLPAGILPGDYRIVSDLYSDRGKVASSTKTVTIMSVKKVETKRIVESGVLSRKISTYVENNGNVPAGGSVSERISWYDKFLLTTVPEASVVPLGDTYLSIVWSYENLLPGERSEIFTYSVSYLPIVLGAVLIFLLIFLAWQRMRPVTVSKEVVKQRIAQSVLEATLSLHVKNTTDKPVFDVTLTDFVPSLVKPVEFGTAKPSSTQAGKFETSLTWKLEEMKAGEERVITYKIRTTVGVLGSIDLPAATLQYKKNVATAPSVTRSNTAECGRNV